MQGDNNDWIKISHFNSDEFETYIQTLSETEQEEALHQYGKKQSFILLEDDMKKYNNFYTFIKNYSPRDYKFIRNNPHVSQRVIATHVELWNSVHIRQIKTLRIFFM